jgi:hypothetical protein
VVLAGPPNKVDGDSTSSDGSAPSGGTAADIRRLTVYADAQERKVGELQMTVLQLESALGTRVVIERAIGMLAERFALPIPDAFELLRAAARNSRREVGPSRRNWCNRRGGRRPR